MYFEPCILELNQSVAADFRMTIIGPELVFLLFTSHILNQPSAFIPIIAFGRRIYSIQVGSPDEIKNVFVWAEYREVPGMQFNFRVDLNCS